AGSMPRASCARYGSGWTMPDGVREWRPDMKILAIALIALATALPAHSQDKPCSKSDAAKAEKALDRVSTWQQLHEAFRDYGHCDQGALEDLHTDTLLRLMVEWRNVEGLAEAMQKDAKYKAFIYRHVLRPMA